MKNVLILLLAGMFLNTALAQTESAEEEDYTVVLPEAAQKCILPAAPDAIPPEATKEQLLVAKEAVAGFQKGLETFRACLQEAEQSPDLTAGNKQALIASFNYSVDSEERVATRFNDAVRSYKERTAGAAGTDNTENR